MKKSMRLLSLLVGLALCIACCMGAILLSDLYVQLEKEDYYSDNLPIEFYGYSILCIADFHDSFYFDQIAEIISEEKPDMVLFLGDMTEIAHSNWNSTLTLLDSIDKSIPVYGVLGNHEVLSSNVQSISVDLEAHGMYLLNNEKVSITRDGASIDLIGLRDITDDDGADLTESWEMEHLQLYLDTAVDSKEFTLIAAHRATLYPYLKDQPADLMLSGHVHGGVVRLPKVGGVFDVDGSFFPDYDKGFYSEGKMDLYVSTGCNFNWGKMRVFNPPTVTLLTLKR